MFFSLIVTGVAHFYNCKRGNILTTELLPPSIGTRGSLNRAVYRIKRAEAGTR
jgi:hypothetical protein